MAGVAVRIIYRASALDRALARAPELVALARSDPRLDPAYLFLRAAAKRGGPVVALVSEGPDPIGCLYAIEDRIRGARSGMFAIGDRTGEGLVLAAPAHRRLVFQHGLRALLSLHRVHTVQINALQSTLGANPLAGLSQRHRVHHSQYTLPNRLSLHGSWDAFLSTLGPDTRRNLRRYPRHAARAGITYASDLDAATFRRAFAAVRQTADRWDGLDPQETRHYADSIIRVGLHSADHGWLGVLAGWRHADVAFVATQMNHAGLRRMSLSMVLRAWLIQDLIDRGVREIVFLDGCAGALTIRCRCCGGRGVLRL